MSEPIDVSSSDTPCESPPPAPRAPETPSDPRAELLRLAQSLVHSRDRRLQMEYLRLRRAVLG